MEIYPTVCKYATIKKQGIQWMILFVVEILPTLNTSGYIL